jgi:hypothetical protein
VPGSYRGQRMGSHMRKDVVQKGRISCRLPPDWGAGLVSKTRPINRNGSEIRREPFLKRPHFSPSGDRAQGGEQKDDRSYTEAVISDPNLLTLPTPNDAIRPRLHAAFLIFGACPRRGSCLSMDTGTALDLDCDVRQPSVRASGNSITTRRHSFLSYFWGIFLRSNPITI